MYIYTKFSILPQNVPFNWIQGQNRVSFTFYRVLRVQILLLGPFGLTLFKLSQTKSNVTKRGNLHCLDIKKGAEAGFTPAPTP